MQGKCRHIAGPRPSLQASCGIPALRPEVYKPELIPRSENPQMTNTDWRNKLYFGDNLDILRENVADESVDLIYLDPSL